MKAKNPPKGRINRLSKIGLSLFNVSKELIFKGENDGQIKAVTELVQTMGELKGAFMKIGQILSITEDSILPEGFSKIFKDLQKNSTFMKPELVDRIFQENFNKKPSEIFKEFTPTPFAAASIGQVHKAILPNGTSVAIKVQYPDMEKNIIDDFKNIKAIEKGLKLIFPNTPNLQELIIEMRENLINECDYQKELNELLEFKERIKDLFPNIKIPTPFAEFSKKNILCMEYLEGDIFEDTLNYDQKTKNILGQTMFDFFMYSVFTSRKLHCDPQNGNFLFNGSEICVLDFGSVKDFSKDFIVSYYKMLRSLENDDFELYKNTLIYLGIGSINDDEKFFKDHMKLVQKVYLPYQKEGFYPLEKINPFSLALDFSKGRNLKGRTPLKDLLLLDRTTLGLFFKLRAWDSKINWSESRKKFRNHLEKEI